MTASKRDKIIKVAKSRFIKKGFANTSMDEISVLAKVSKGGLYHHFSTKDEILMTIFVENQENVRKKEPKLFEKKEKIMSDLGKFYDSLDLHRDLMSIWFQALGDTKNNSKFQRLMLERRHTLRELHYFNSCISSHLDFSKTMKKRTCLNLQKEALHWLRVVHLMC